MNRAMNARDVAITANTAQNEQPQQAGADSFSGRSAFQQRGLTTNSPPAKVKNRELKPFDILASGVDTLHLAIDVTWRDSAFFEFLADKKALAKETREEVAIYLTCENSNVPFPFAVKPSGAGGYEWLLESNDMTLKIANSLRPTSRPSVHVELRSEALWRLGVREATLTVIFLLMGQGGANIVTSPSRADLCVDLLMPAELWNLDIIYSSVCRADDVTPYLSRRRWAIKGIGIGKGKLLARLYDKPLEIRQKSKKFWMYDMWNIAEVPKGFKIIRCEFQLRREALVELGMRRLEDFLGHLDSLWGHCTKKWLKFKDNQEKKHHTQRKVLPWWQAVQNGFQGVQDPTPAIRAKALNAKHEELSRQGVGYMTSAAAIQLENDLADLHESVGPLAMFEAALADPKYHPSRFHEEVQKKRLKYHRQVSVYHDKNQLRKALGLPHD